MAAPHRRAQAQLVGARRRHLRSRHQAQARRRRRSTEIEDVLIRADLGLETADRIAAALGEGRHDAAISPDEVKAVVAAEVEKVLAPVAQPLVDRSGEKAVRHPGRRRQRLRQDHDHRQARGEIPRRRPHGHAGGRRHVPRRRHRSAENLGRAHRRGFHRARGRRRCRRPRLRCGHRGESSAASTCC